MVKSVLQKPHSEAHVARNAFDVGYTNKFTSCLGMLLPCFVRECNPNEHYRITPSMFLRSMPMNSAAFIQCTQHVEFYFVPMRLLWYFWPQFITGTKYATDNSQSSVVPTTPPTFDLSAVVYRLTSNVARIQKGQADTLGSDVLGYSFSHGALRLLDLLGYGDHHCIVNSASSPLLSLDAYSVNALRLLAYQKVCNDYYRVPAYEADRINSYNVGCAQSVVLQDHSQDSITPMMKPLLALRYRPWKKDMFTISSPSFQGSDFMTSNFMAPIFPSYSGNDTGRFTPSVDSSYDSFQGRIVAPNGSALSYLNLTASNLRSAFALDKLYRLSASAADGDYQSQIQARYGFKAYSPTTKCEFIGSASSAVKIDSLTTTADTLSDNGGTPAGRIYANGIGSTSQPSTFEYDVKEHGIIIGLSSFVPDIDYSSYGCNSFNTKFEVSDWFQPEFDNLGKQPLTSDLLSVYNLSFSKDGDIDVSRASVNNSVLGWYPRYIEYKTHVDEVHGELNGNLARKWNYSPTLSVWTAPRFNYSDSSQFANWLKSGLSLDFFYINPNLYDSIFVNQYQGLQSQDQFICEVHNSVQAVLPMSVSGEPLI